MAIDVRVKAERVATDVSVRAERVATDVRVMDMLCEQ